MGFLNLTLIFFVSQIKFSVDLKSLLDSIGLNKFLLWYFHFNANSFFIEFAKTSLYQFLIQNSYCLNAKNYVLDYQCLLDGFIWAWV